MRGVRQPVTAFWSAAAGNGRTGDARSFERPLGVDARILTLKRIAKPNQTPRSESLNEAARQRMM
jgi:hypothetical protein